MFYLPTGDLKILSRIAPMPVAMSFEHVYISRLIDPYLHGHVPSISQEIYPAFLLRINPIGRLPGTQVGVARDNQGCM